MGGPSVSARAQMPRLLWIVRCGARWTNGTWALFQSWRAPRRIFFSLIHSGPPRPHLPADPSACHGCAGTAARCASHKAALRRREGPLPEQVGSMFHPEGNRNFTLHKVDSSQCGRRFPRAASTRTSPTASSSFLPTRSWTPLRFTERCVRSCSRTVGTRCVCASSYKRRRRPSCL